MTATLSELQALDAKASAAAARNGIAAHVPALTLYTKPNCPQCTVTKRMLDKKGIDYRTVDITEDAGALALVRQIGHLQAPVIIRRDSEGQIIESWSGFNPGRIEALSQASAKAA